MPPRRTLTAIAGATSLAVGAAWFLRPTREPLWHDGVGAMWLATGFLWLLVMRRQRP